MADESFAPGTLGAAGRVFAPDPKEKPPSLSAPSGMALAVLGEIAHRALRREPGGRDSVTLRGLPLSPNDFRWLRSVLGEGEVRIVINALGETEILETGFSGVWWIRDRDPDGAVRAEHVEIASVPLLASAHEDDMRVAAQRLLAAAEKARAGAEREPQDERPMEETG